MWGQPGALRGGYSGRVQGGLLNASTWLRRRHAPRGVFSGLEARQRAPCRHRAGEGGQGPSPLPHPLQPCPCLACRRLKNPAPRYYCCWQVEGLRRQAAGYKKEVAVLERKSKKLQQDKDKKVGDD